MIVSQAALQAIRLLNEGGYEAYLVGGCVRDDMLGILPHDYDICTAALPEEMQQVFHAFRTVETGLKHGTLTVLVDSAGESIPKLKPLAVVDAILAKKNLGTSRDMAPITVALGPGFTAGVDVDAVVETKRGHNLGRVLWTGSAAPNTGIPGAIAGYSKERVIHCPAKGILRNAKHITDTVSKGEIIAFVETENGPVPVKATLDGILRGLIRDGYPVNVGFKMADIDPRTEELGNCFTISDKARCIAGGVLEAILQRKGELGL